MKTENNLDLVKEAISLSKSGFAGVDKNGSIVDRRECPDAVPMAENTMFGIPAPLPIGKDDPK